uniref:NADH-ubiquinone oxidoreductase chain 6 n=1 Tax=Aeluroscalabotes felinus TaxID=96749 RepID=A0A1Y1CC79_AELFE|nr:NADH dehydrogenase subunit 6 [Aeluroscalabotes felinus]BAX77934.1 NADH dehydrogenase subunit 6 [Aeluroscalabotes felinus]
MSYFLVFLSLFFVLCLAGVAANPFPLFGAIGLIFATLIGCGILVLLGMSLISMILLLIYLGGMLVVFAYSIALSAEAYPETWLDYSVFMYLMAYGFLFYIFISLSGDFNLIDGWGILQVDAFGFFDLRLDISGIILLYSDGGPLLLLCAGGLLLVLFVVLELSRGRMRGGGLRSV